MRECLARLAGWVAVVTALVVPATATAAGTCVKNGTTVEVAGAAADPGTSFVIADNGTMIVDGVACAGTPTLTNVDSIVIDANGNSLSFSYSGAIGPGVTPEADGSPEVEVTVSDEAHFSLNDLGSLPSSNIAIGLTGGERRINLTAGVLTDDDADITGLTAANGALINVLTGDDTVSTAGGRGTGGPDTTLVQNRPAVTLAAGPGHDTLTGPAVFAGGPGDDSLTAGAPSTEILADFGGVATLPLRMKPDRSGTEPGADGQGGTDTYHNLDVPSALRIVGGSAPDVLYGGPQTDNLEAGDGDDMLFGRDGVDGLFGQAGADLIDGGAGNDLINGGIDADAAGDTIIGGTGSDFIFGTGGADDIRAVDGEPDRIECGPAVDKVLVDNEETSVAPDCEFEPLRLSLGSAGTAAEGTSLSVPVTMSGVADIDVTATVTPAAGTASAGGDFAAAPVQITIPAGATAANAAISTLDDALDEGDETFELTLADPSLGEVASAKTTATITDTDLTLACRAAPTFDFGQSGAVVRADVSDAGAAAGELTAPADTTGAGDKSAALVTADRAGASIGIDCPYKVLPPPPPPPLALCNGLQISVLEVIPSGRRVRVTGIALVRYAGQKATIRAAGRNVGSTTIGGDGTFATTVSAPQGRARESVRYEAAIGSVRSRAIKLDRRLRITSRRGRTIRGVVLHSRRLRPKTIQLVRQITCAQRRVFATVKLKRDGSFAVTLAGPTGGQQFALYRVIAKLRGGERTYTLPIAIGA